jgi:hypothetical protein
MTSVNFKVVLVDVSATASMEDKIEYNPLHVTAQAKTHDDHNEENMDEDNSVIFNTEDIDIDGAGIALFDMTWDEFKSRVEKTDDAVNMYKLNTEDCDRINFTKLCSEDKYSFKLNTSPDVVSNLEGITNMEGNTNMYNIEFENVFTADGGKAHVNIEGDYKGNSSYVVDDEGVELSIKGEGRDTDPYGSDDPLVVNWSKEGMPKINTIDICDMGTTAIVKSLLSRNDGQSEGLENLKNVDVKKHLDTDNVVNFPFYLVSMSESMDFAPTMSFDNGSCVEVSDKQCYQIVIRVGNENVCSDEDVQSTDVPKVADVNEVAEVAEVADVNEVAEVAEVADVSGAVL